MQMQGSRLLHAPRERVWALLSEPPLLREFIPGCESIARQPDGAGYDAVVGARIGPVAARFSGTLVLEPEQPPQRYRLRFQGQGGAAGFASGEAVVELAEQGPTTLLNYTVQARIGGKLAQVGSRLIDATASRLADEFFVRIAARFEAAVPDAVQDAAPAPEPALTAAPAHPPGGRRAGRRAAWLVAGGLVLLAALWWLANRTP